MALPIHPLFVYDGKNKPLTKRGQTVSRYGTNLNNELSKKLLQQFRFPCHTAPGEAEAECAYLQQNGLVDMVMSQDGDAIMFGSNWTLRNWTKEGTRSASEPTHVDLINLGSVKEGSGLDPDGMILVALLSGGDYNQHGVPGFGIQMACDTARAGFGTDLLEAIRSDNEFELAEWRDRLNHELETNESGYFKKRHKTVKIPEDFPDREILSYYTDPTVSSKATLGDLAREWSREWDAEINVVALRRYVAQTFDWTYKPGAWKLVRTLARPYLANRLQNGTANQLVNSTTQLSERRMHYCTGGLPEIRVAVTPADIVGLDLDAEEDSPEYLAELENEQDGEDYRDDEDTIETTRSPRKATKPAWNPFTVERMWLLETQVELGVPQILEEWNMMQREKAEAVRFKEARRKGRLERTKSAPMKQTERIERYFTASKADYAIAAPKEPTAEPVERSPLKERVNITTGVAPVTPTKKSTRPKSKPLLDSSLDLTRYFQPAKHGTRPVLSREATVVKDVELRDLKHSRPQSSASMSRDDLDLPVFSFSAKGSVENPIALTSSPAVASTCSTEMLQTPASTSKRRDLSQPLQKTPPLRHIEESVTQRKAKRNTRRKIERSRTEGSEPFEGSTPLALGSPDHSVSQAQSEAAGLDDSQDYELPFDPGTGLKLGFGRKKLFAIPRESLEGTWKHVDMGEEGATPTSRRGTRVSCVNLAAG